MHLDMPPSKMAALPKRAKLSMISNEVFLEKAKEKFINNLERAKFFDFVKFPDTPISVSQLVARVDGDAESHFEAQWIDGKTKKQLRKMYIEPLFDTAIKRFQTKSLQLILTEFQYDMLKNLTTLDGESANEAEVRFSLGDPLVRLLMEFDAEFKVCTFVQSSSLTYGDPN